jgi:hypothetical protein
MGGNALKHCVTRRYARDEFEELTSALKTELSDMFQTRVELIPHYLEKESFGDADFLIESDQLPPDWISRLVDFYQLRSEEWVKNSNVLSFARRQLQVDLICTEKKYFKSSLDYFAYNDMSNITGRMAHKLGIKHGHKGLELIIRHRAASDHVLGTISLEVDNAKEVMYEILGLDPTFVPRTLEDMFKFVASSKFFDPEIFSLDNRNTTSRTRDRKRKTYSAFLEWCEKNPGQKKFDFPEKSEHGGYSLREPWYTDIVLQRWPWVKEQVDQLKADFELDLKFREVYNGNIVAARTGFAGKVLGAFMSKMRESGRINKQLWIDDERILNLNIDELFLQLGGAQFMNEQS